MLACQCRFEHDPYTRACSGMHCAKRTLCTGTGFFQFYYEAFAEPLQMLSKKFLPLAETNEALEELLSFYVEV